MAEKIIIDTGPSAHGSHAAAAFLHCPQKYAYWKHAPESAVPGPQMVRGSLGHVGLAQLNARLGFRQKGLDPDVFEHPLIAVGKVARDYGIEGSADTQNVIAMLRAYAAHFKERYRVDAVEEEIGTIFVDERDGFSAPYTARVDVRVIDADGKIWFHDHKHQAYIEDRNFAGFVMSLQFLGQQYLGYRLYGDRFGGIIINGIEMGKVGTVAGAYKFIRAQLPPAPGALRKVPATVLYAARQAAALEAMNLDIDEWPANPSDSTCTGRWGKCEFYDRCRWGKP